MKIILCVLSLLVGVLGFLGIHYICKKETLKKREGIKIIGKKVSCEEMLGTPNRYIVEVEYEIQCIANRKKLVTTDKNIKKCNNGESISLIYVEKTNKVYWGEEESYENTVVIIMLAVLCVFSFILALTFVLTI